MKKALVLIALMANIGIIGAATYSGTCGQHLTWSLNTEDSTLTINGYGAMSSGNVAPWCGTYGSYTQYVKHVLLPDGLTTIGEYAFYKCNRINSINIPNSVTSIGKCAFEGCYSLTSVVMSINITGIEWRTFYGCNSLTTITIPNNVTSVGMEAFKYCTSLTSIELPNSITYIWIRRHTTRSQTMDCN